MKALERVRGRAAGRVAVLSAVWNHPLNRGSRPGAIRDYLLWNAFRFTMAARPLVRLTDDLEIILGRGENYGSAVYAHGVADYAEMLFVAHAMRPDEVFVDVGGNVGMYSVWAAGVAGARVIAFEPVPETHETFLKNVRLNGLDDRVTLHRMAAGAVDGTLRMAARGGLAHVVENGARADGASVVEVPVGRVDAICEGESATLMKVDVEGFEKQALLGATGLLAQPSLRAVIVELQDWTLRKFGTSEREVRALLERQGFEACAYDPDARKLGPARSDGGLNAIFVRDREAVAARCREAPRVRLPFRPSGV